jgi:hypothetical protein
MTPAVILAALVFAGQAKEVKEASGTVKSLSDATIVVTDKAGKDWTFTIDSKETVFVTKHARYKIDDLNVGGQKASVSNFLSEGNTVAVKYSEKGNKWLAEKVSTGGGGDPCYPPKCKCRDGGCETKCCGNK